MDVHLDRPEIQVWIMGLAESLNELKSDKFESSVGLTLTDERKLSRRLVAARDTGKPGHVRLSVTIQEIHAICRALEIAMQGLGEVEFETVVGQSWDFGKRTLSRLRELTGSAAE